MKLHVALSRFSWKNKKRIDTLHGAASFLGCSVQAPEKLHLYNGNYLEEREIACYPKHQNKVGPPMFHFLSNCRFRQTSTIYAPGLARSSEKDPFL